MSSTHRHLFLPQVASNVYKSRKYNNLIFRHISSPDRVLTCLTSGTDNLGGSCLFLRHGISPLQKLVQSLHFYVPLILTNIDVRKVGPVFPGTSWSLYPGFSQFSFRLSSTNFRKAECFAIPKTQLQMLLQPPKTYGTKLLCRIFGNLRTHFESVSR